jgi:hypothetical protein
MNYTFRPLRWAEASTPASARRSRWTFKAGWQDTLDLLARELEHLKARDVVIEADFREQDLRLDGMPRANARQPEHPGVRIAFESRYGPLVYSTDSCAFWQHNVRSIALGLEALRAVDRYGVTKRGEQYTGWKELSSAPADVPLSEVDAWGVLSRLARLGPDDLPSDERIISLARRYAHPDHGGTAETWADFDRAYKLVRP